MHTDLHPGNILVRMHNPNTGCALSDEEAGFSRMLLGGDLWSEGAHSASAGPAPTSRSSALVPHAQIVLLDFGEESVGGRVDWGSGGGNFVTAHRAPRPL